MNLPSNLKRLRNKKELTQEEISKDLKINRATYAHYETGRREPDVETLELLANYFNVSVDYLLGRTDNPSPILGDSASSIDNEITEIMRDLGPDVTVQFRDLKGMSDEEKEDLKLFLQLLKAKRNK